MKIKTVVFLSVIATLLLVSCATANEAHAQDEKQSAGEHKVAYDGDDGGYGGGYGGGWGGRGGGGWGGGGPGGGGWGGGGPGGGGGWGGGGGGWGGGGGCRYGRCCNWGRCRCCYSAQEALAFMQTAQP